MENGQKSAEWEAQVFNRSRTREEYVKLVATLIWKLRDYNKKVRVTFGLGRIMKTQIFFEIFWRLTGFKTGFGRFEIKIAWDFFHTLDC